jgi:hypothetical protein
MFLGYRHPPVGTTARNTVHATFRLLLPAAPSGADGDGLTAAPRLRNNGDIQCRCPSELCGKRSSSRVDRMQWNCRWDLRE